MASVILNKELLPDGNFREYYSMNRVKFDDDAKQLFLNELANHGRMTTACRSVGISSTTANRHIRADKVFALAVQDALDLYKDKLIAHHQDLVFNGTEKVSYGRDGGIISKETIYPIQLIAMELRKHDEGYRDKQQVDVHVTGGVMVAPAAVNSIEDWEKKYGKKDEEGSKVLVIEGEVVDSNDAPPPLGK